MQLCDIVHRDSYYIITSVEVFSKILISNLFHHKRNEG